MRHDIHKIQELVGRKHFDLFTIISDNGGRVKVRFTKGGRTVSMYPWKDRAMTLRHLHGLVCRRFNYDTAAKIRAVISVPAYFTHFQRAETMPAGRWRASM